MLWMLTMRRATNLATTTLESNFYAIKLLYSWSHNLGIDIEHRMLSGEYFDANELSAIAMAVRQPLRDLTATSLKPTDLVGKFKKLMPAKDKSVFQDNQVCPNNSASRMGTIIDYLGWLSLVGIQSDSKESRENKHEMRAEMLNGLRARVPKTRKRNQVGQREAPPSKEIDSLLGVSAIDSESNPWTDARLRHRNQLIIHTLFDLGIRRGEALGIKIEDIDFQANTLIITRNADDPTDPRRYQPRTKTFDRILTINENLVRMMLNYITTIRRFFPLAKKHSFLFVSHASGAPLSLASVNKMFVAIRKRELSVPRNLSPHLLRHAWNDRFSQICDEKGIPEVKEEQIRNENMGWVHNSGTSAIYTRRHVRRMSEKLSLEHQNNLYPGNFQK
jgi:integrase